AHTTTGCGEQGFPSAQPYLSHTPGANPFCCMFLHLLFLLYQQSLLPFLVALSFSSLGSLTLKILALKIPSHQFFSNSHLFYREPTWLLV
ncbi:hypothetical protein BO99DRAFT_341251, partial [Aspergillus violaceofuscus CBS 115571]